MEQGSTITSTSHVTRSLMYEERVSRVNWQLRLRRNNAGDMGVVVIVDEGCDGSCRDSATGNNYDAMS